MFALNLLSEGAEGPDLTWLLWLVLALFVLIVIIGWMTSKKGEKPPVSVAEKKEKIADDLTKLEGIGPKVATVLAAAGIVSFSGLASADVEKLRATLKEAGLQMMEPAGWIEQADLAAKGEMEALAKLQDELKGGRRA
ncbi:MAG: helix-hairpin-helix domain-containing protein [Anaerolineales bacterium]|nr:helix-hairpin-helix domain-containing protein [Anaerolineales bacterium]